MYVNQLFEEKKHAKISMFTLDSRRLVFATQQCSAFFTRGGILFIVLTCPYLSTSLSLSGELLPCGIRYDNDLHRADYTAVVVYG